MQRTLTALSTGDFALSPRAPQWSKALPQTVEPVSGPLSYRTTVQVLYSPTGLYLRFCCEDRRLSCSCLKNMGSLYTGDVAEAFFWPREDLPVYFEYELSPLNKELCLLVCNTGSYYGWTPFEYQGRRRTRHYAKVAGGEQAPFAGCTGWECGAFIPFALLEGLCPPPKAGDRWRAGFFRIDYDEEQPTHFAWDPDTGKEFHQFRRFGTLLFG